jgi:hypothetical protein
MLTIHVPKGEQVASVPTNRELRDGLRKLPPGGYTVHQNGQRVASAVVQCRKLFGNPIVTTVVTTEK